MLGSIFLRLQGASMRQWIRLAGTAALLCAIFFAPSLVAVSAPLIMDLPVDCHPYSDNHANRFDCEIVPNVTYDECFSILADGDTAPNLEDYFYLVLPKDGVLTISTVPDGPGSSFQPLDTDIYLYDAVDDDLLDSDTSTNFDASVSYDAVSAGYIIAVRAGNAANSDDMTFDECYELTITFTDTSAPTTPNGLTATPAQTSITLNWNDIATNETNYIVEWSPNGNNQWTPINLAANTETYTHSGLTCDTRYFYRLRAYNGTVPSGLLSINETTLECTGAPGSPLPPDGVTATAVSRTQIVLAWNDLATDETNYYIERSPNGVNTWVQIADLPAGS
jgi:hypothetical protein